MKPDKISGSRYDDGNVPNVNWNDSKLNVNWYNPDNCNDNLRARAEVSKKRDPNYSGISLIFGKSSRYFLFSIIFKSDIILMSLFKISIFSLAAFNLAIFLDLISKEALIVKLIASRQMFSTFK
jgi:hypothetical protein